MKNLDFMAVVDVLPMEQTRYADLAASRSNLSRALRSTGHRYHEQASVCCDSAARRRAMYESKPGWWIAKETAKRLGLADYFPWSDPDDHLRRLIAPLNINEQELKALGAVSFDGRPYIEDRGENDGPLFPTQSGKIELLSSVLKDLNLDALPKYEAVEEPPSGYLRLIYGRSPVHSFTRSANNAWLDDLMAENPVWIGSRAAQKLAVHDGEKVVLENQDGVKSPAITVRVTPAIRDDVAYTVHGFDPQAPGLKKAYQHGFSDNALMTRMTIDPLTGTTGMRVNFVRVHPAQKG